MIKIVCKEEGEDQIKARLEKSFWEKLGFQDKKKEDRNLRDAKEKVDITYRALKETVANSVTLQNKLENSRLLIKTQENK